MARQLGRGARNLACRSAGVRRGLFHLQDAAGNLKVFAVNLRK
jgi:hypothetical protein